MDLKLRNGKEGAIKAQDPFGVIWVLDDANNI